MIRSAVVAFAFGLLAVLAGRAHAETPTAFNLAQASTAQWQDAGRPMAARRSRLEQIIPLAAPASDVIAWLGRHLGQHNFTRHQGQPWCAYGLSDALVATGHRPLASGMAASALAYGPRLPGPHVGAIAVLGRHGRIYHVGLVEAVYGDRIGILSANWSHRVARAVISRRQVAAFIGV